MTWHERQDSSRAICDKYSNTFNNMLKYLQFAERDTPGRWEQVENKQGNIVQKNKLAYFMSYVLIKLKG